MQTPVLQILGFFTHYESKDIKEAIKIWASDKVLNKAGQRRALEAQGWQKVDKKPEKREYLLIGNEYFIQDPEKRKELERESRIEDLKRKIMRRKSMCPACKKYQMRLFPVNSSNRDRVPGEWKSQWVCPDINCGYEKYSTNTVKEEIERLRGEKNGTR